MSPRVPKLYSENVLCMKLDETMPLENSTSPHGVILKSLHYRDAIGSILDTILPLWKNSHDLIERWPN